jgi:uncharacterized membrane protein YfcA
MSLLATSTIIAIAFLGEATFGFAGGMISVPLLSLFIGVKDAVTVVLVFQLLMGLLLIRGWREIDRRTWRIGGISVMVGTFLGTCLLGIASPQVLKVVLLCVIVIYLVKEFFLSWLRVPEALRGGAAVLGGLGGGLLQGLVGMGGPPLLIYLKELDLPKAAFRATIIFLLFVSNVVRLPTSLYAGLVTDPVLLVVAYAVPGFLIALVLGQRLHGVVPERAYQLSVYSVLVLAAVSISTQLLW